MIQSEKSQYARRGRWTSLGFAFVLSFCALVASNQLFAGIRSYTFSTEEALADLGTRTSRLRHTEIGKYRPIPEAEGGSCTSSFFNGVNPYEPLNLLNGVVNALDAGEAPAVPAFAFGGHLDAVHVVSETFTSAPLGAATRGCDDADSKSFLVSVDEESQIVDVPLATAKQTADDLGTADAQAAFQEQLETLRASPSDIYLFEPNAQTATRYLEGRGLFWDQPQADIDAIYQGAGATGSDAIVFSVDEDVAIFRRATNLADPDFELCGFTLLGGVTNILTGLLVQERVANICETESFFQQGLHNGTEGVENKVLPGEGGSSRYDTVAPGPKYPNVTAGTGASPADFADPNDIVQHSLALGASRLLFDLDNSPLTVKVWRDGAGDGWGLALDGEVNITGVHLLEFAVDSAGNPVVCQLEADPGDATRAVNLDACPIIFSVDRPVQLTLGSTTEVFTEKDMIQYQPAVAADPLIGFTQAVPESLGRYDDKDRTPPVDGDMRAAFDGDVGREQLFGISLEALDAPGGVPNISALPSVRTVYFTTTSEDRLTETYADGTAALVFASPDGSGAPFSHTHGASDPDADHPHHFNFDAVHVLDDAFSVATSKRFLFSNQDPVIRTDDPATSRNEEVDVWLYENGVITPWSGFPADFPGDVDALSLFPNEPSGAGGLSSPDTDDKPVGVVFSVFAETTYGGVTFGRGELWHCPIGFDVLNASECVEVFDQTNFSGGLGNIDAVHVICDGGDTKVCELPNQFVISVDVTEYAEGVSTELGGLGNVGGVGISAGKFKISQDELLYIKMKISSDVVPRTIEAVTILELDAIAEFLPTREMPHVLPGATVYSDQTPGRQEPEPLADPYTAPADRFGRPNIDALYIQGSFSLEGVDHFEIIPDALTGVSCLPLPVEIRAAGALVADGAHSEFNYQDTIEIKATDGAGVLVPSSITLGQEKNPGGTLVTDADGNPVQEDGVLVTDADGNPVQEDGVLVDSGTLGACDAGVANDGIYCYQFPSAGDTSVNLLLQPLVEPAAGQTVDINLDVLGIPDGKTEGYQTDPNNPATRTEDPTMSFSGVALKFCEGTPDGTNAEWCNDRISVQVSGKTSDQAPTHGPLYLRLVTADEGSPLSCETSDYAQSRTVLMAYECVDPGTCRAGEDVTVDGVTISQLSEGYTVVTLTPDNPSDPALQPYLPYEFQYPEAGVLRLHAQMIRPVGPFLPSTTTVTDGTTLEAGTILEEGTTLPSGDVPETTTLIEDTVVSTTPLTDAQGLEVAEVPTIAELPVSVVYVSGTSADFVVRPFAYRFSNIQETAASNKTNPGGTSVTGDGFIPAASEFDYTIEAITWEAVDDDEPNVPQDAHIDIEPADTNANEHPELIGDLSAANQVTENFTALAGQSVAHSIESYSPTGAGRVEGALGIASSAADGVDDANFAAITNGSGTLSGQTYSEVGSIILRATTPEYFESFAYERDPGVGPDNDVWGISPVIGRFYPFDFLVSGSFNESGPCTDGFVYMDEPGAINVNVEVTAKNALAETTLNYDNVDTSYKFTASLAAVAENEDDGNDISSRMDIDLSAVNWSDGAVTYAGSHTFSRQPPNSAPDGPYPAVQLGVILNPSVDPIEIVGRVDMNSSQADDCTKECDAKKVGGTLDVRYGRMDIADVSSNSTDDIAVIFRAEYFDKATNQFVLNTDDQCSVFAMGPGADPDNPGGESQQFGLEATNTATGDTDTNQPGPNDFEVDAGTTFDTHIYDPAGDPNVPVTSATLNINNGYAELFLRAPGEGSKGYVDVSLRELVLRDSWLSFDWDGDGSITDSPGDYPVGRVTFGRYEGLSGDGRVRYWKEIFR